MPVHKRRWSLPSSTPRLERNEVHVWRVRLDQIAIPLLTLVNVLSTDERQRAAQLQHPTDREQFIVVRGILRLLLANYLDRAPTSIAFRYGKHGKPALVQAHPDHNIQLNLSHSHTMALFAFALERRVGIDLEHIVHNPDSLTAAQFLSPTERTTLQQYAPSQRQAAFYRCWTRKEAYAKAHGDGLALRFDHFDVSLAVNPTTSLLLHVHDDPTAQQHWSLRSLDPGQGYTAALAVEGHGWHVKCWDWPPSGTMPLVRMQHRVTAP